MLVIDEITPFHASLEHNLQTMPRGCDVDKKNAEFSGTLLKVGGSKFFTLNS